jgi:hypothetical protein
VIPWRRGAALALLLLSAGCREEEERTSVIRMTERAQAPNPNAGLSSEPFLGGVARVEVAGYPDRPTFFVVARTAAIQKFPCSQCHTLPLQEMHGGGDRKRAHWDVALQHAPVTVMSCTTCHASGNLDSLATLQGTPVAFDGSYQVCAQCHAPQASDWASGAHGKRVGGWAPPRVVLGCPACHDPHRPAWGTRWPAVAGGGEPGGHR